MAQGGRRGTPGRRVNTESAELEVVFRIIHVTLGDEPAPPDGRPPSYREQTVEVALGPNPTFQNRGVGALMRRVPVGRVVSAVPSSRYRARRRSPKRVGLPRVVETLRKAIEWRRQLDAGEVPNQAAIARREGITRARVTQVLALLRLSPEIQKRILSRPNTIRHPAITERALRPIAQLESAAEQKAGLQKLIEQVACPA